MANWTSLYLCVFNSAILAGTIQNLLELHFFFNLGCWAIALLLWWYWHQNYGEITVSNQEYGLKIGLLGVMAIGWLIGVRG